MPKFYHYGKLKPSEASRCGCDIKKTFRTADVVGSQTIFNIGGNNYRLVARGSYALQTVLVQHVLTHAKYDKEDWKE